MTTNARNLNTDAVNEMTAYRYSDTYAIIRTNTGQCIGCEHNQCDADAVRRFADNHHSGIHHVERNTPDQVRRAKEFRRDPFRYALRTEAFMGAIS